HAVVLYWMNSLARNAQQPNRFLSDIERVFVHLLDHARYQDAANLLIAIQAELAQPGWILPISLAVYARRLAPFLAHISASDDFKRFIALAAIGENLTPKDCNA